MDSHLEAIPGLGTFTAGGFTGGNFEDAGGETDGALDAEVLGLGTLDQVGGDCRISIEVPGGGGGRTELTLLESLDFTRGQSDTDPVDLGPFPELALLWLVV